MKTVLFFLLLVSTAGTYSLHKEEGRLDEKWVASLSDADLSMQGVLMTAWYHDETNMKRKELYANRKKLIQDEAARRKEAKIKNEKGTS